MFSDENHRTRSLRIFQAYSISIFFASFWRIIHDVHQRHLSQPITAAIHTWNNLISRALFITPCNSLDRDAGGRLIAVINQHHSATGLRTRRNAFTSTRCFCGALGRIETFETFFRWWQLFWTTIEKANKSETNRKCVWSSTVWSWRPHRRQFVCDCFDLQLFKLDDLSTCDNRSYRVYRLVYRLNSQYASLTH